MGNLTFRDVDAGENRGGFGNPGQALLIVTKEMSAGVWAISRLLMW